MVVAMMMGMPGLAFWGNAFNVVAEGALGYLVYSANSEAEQNGFSTTFAYITHGVNALISSVLAYTIFANKPADKPHGGAPHAADGEKPGNEHGKPHHEKGEHPAL